MKVSIITPSFNQGEFIEDTIRSVLNQSYENIEHIIVDGGSTDNTIEILRKYNGKVIWISEKDNGQSDALNKAVKLATGDIIGWCNADDTYETEIVKDSVNEFLKNKNIGMTYSRVNLIGRNGKVIREYPIEKFVFKKFLLKKPGMIPSQGVFIKKAILKEIGYFNEKLHYAMDYDLFLKITAKWEIIFIPKILANFRVYDEAKTQKLYWKTCKEAYFVSRENGAPLISPLLFRFLKVRLKSFFKPLKRMYENRFNIERKF